MSAGHDELRDRLIDVLLEEMGRAEARPDLADRVLARVQQAQARRRWTAVAAAAVVLLALGLARAWRPSEPDLPAWLASGERPALAFATGGTMELGASDPLRGGTVGGVDQGGDGGPGRDQDGDRAVQGFVAQFGFAFRIPHVLPGGWVFRRAVPMGRERVRLVYAHEDRGLAVHLWPEPGADRAPAVVRVGSRAFVLARYRGLAFSSEGGVADPDTWTRVISLFAPDAEAPGEQK